MGPGWIDTFNQMAGHAPRVACAIPNLGKCRGKVKPLSFKGIQGIIYMDFFSRYI